MKGILILIGVILFAAFFCGVLPWLQVQVLGIPPATLPVIELPAENITANPLIDLPGPYNDIYLTNTLLATILADLIIIGLAILGTRRLREVPEGTQNVLEMFVETLYNLTEQVVGSKFTRQIFAIVATIFIFILVANWVEFIPGVDSIGIMHHAHEGEGFDRKEIGDSGIFYLDVPHSAEAALEGEEATHPETEAGDHEEKWVVTPFLRPAATDLNMTVGLAIVSFLVIQWFGLRELGINYVAKFINTPALERGGMGFIDFGVGLLELILEPVKIISLSFRLLGNVFAGAVLLFVMSSLIPFILPAGLYGFEMFIGAIQAFVFAMLTLMFSGIAMTPHAHEEQH